METLTTPLFSAAPQAQSVPTRVSHLVSCPKNADLQGRVSPCVPCPGGHLLVLPAPLLQHQETGLCYISQTEPGPDGLGRCEPEPHPEHLVGQTCSPHPTGGMSPAEARGRAQSLANPDERSCQLSLGPESLLEGGWGGARPSRLLSSAHFPSGDKEHRASMWKEGNERRLRTGHEPICFQGRENKRPLPDRTRLSHARPPGLRSRARGCQHSGDLAVGNSAASRGAPVNPQTRIPVETKPAQLSWTTRDAGGGDEKQEGDLGPQATAWPASQDLRAADVRRRSPGTSSGLAHALTSSPGDTRRTPGPSAGRGSTLDQHRGSLRRKRETQQEASGRSLSPGFGEIRAEGTRAGTTSVGDILGRQRHLNLAPPRQHPLAST